MVCVEMQLNVNLELLSRCASVSVIGTDTVTMALHTAYAIPSFLLWLTVKETRPSEDYIHF